MNHLKLGFSPCPNDTFMFHALVNGEVTVAGVEWEVVMEDIERLNRLAFEEVLDLTKISFHAFGHLREKYALLSSGAALGRGCGPLVVARDAASRDRLEQMRIAIPGWHTSATMLLRLMEPRLEREQLIEMPFDRILAATASGEVDAGLIIHESRFTYRDHDLACLADLGEWWEREFGHPIPLGGIIVHRRLAHDLRAALETAVRDSVAYAQRNPEASADYVRRHAQEILPEVQKAHIDLYVNEYSVALGATGETAVRAFFEAAEERGILPRYVGPLLVGDESGPPPSA